MDLQKWPKPLMAPDKGGGSAEDEGEISYEQAKQIQGGSLILQKQYSQEGWRRMVDEELQAVPDEVRRAMYQPMLPGRIPSHLLRLLSRKGPEYDFGAALLQYGPQYFKENEDLHWSANMVISSEFADTVMWWTFAPYIFENLVSKGVAPKEAIEKIIDWAKTSEAANGGHDFELISKQTLAGLEVLQKEGVRRYALSHKLDDLSHKFTKQEAERIVRDVFGITEEKR